MIRLDCQRVQSFGTVVGLPHTQPKATKERPHTPPRASEVENSSILPKTLQRAGGSGWAKVERA